MQRISSWTKLVTALGLFRYGTVTGGVAPTPLKAEWLNMVQEELANFILAYLPALDADDNTQLLKAIQAFGAAYPLKATTLAGYGIGDAYTQAAVNALLAAKQIQIDNLQANKQEKNTALMGANGWRLDKATGLLEQWGNGYCPPDATTAAINFPTPFAEVYNCFGNKVTPNSQDGDGNAAGALAISATQYQLFNDTVAYGATIHWRAIGLAPGY